MGAWNYIFKKRGRVFFKPQEDMSKVIRLLKKEKAKRILDLGCGSGRHTIMLAKAGFDVYGMDASKEGLKQTKEWLKKEKLKAKLKKASCYKKFPFKKDFFDATISIQVIHHAKIKQIRYCISEIERVLKPKGIAFVTVTKAICGRRATKFKKVAPRTYIMLDGDEKGVVHYVYTQKLMRKDFKKFSVLDIHEDSGGHDCILGRLKA